MKTLRFFALLTIIPLLSCSDDDNAVVAPSLSFDQSSIETSFFSEGTSDAPSITWNGEEGTFSLGTPVTGVSIDPTDGIISWDKNLPIGMNEFEVIATNSAGTSAVTVEINNQFSGDFVGGYNEFPESETLDYYFEIEFYADGSLNIIHGGEDIADGTWTLTGTSFTAVYTYYEGGGTFSLGMEVLYDNDAAYLEGYWYPGDNPVEGNESGFVRLRL